MKLSVRICILSAAATGHVSAFLLTAGSGQEPLLSSLWSTAGDSWQGDVVPNAGGTIRGCNITPVGEDPITDWEITIDGLEADLGRFSEAIYKKVTADAKQQQFQGFRPGTIPPHIEPTYRAFSMDECARETVLEAMEQNNIRPFTDARSELLIENVSIPPPPKRKGGRKKKGGRKARAAAEAAAAAEAEQQGADDSQWKTFATMKEAIDAGWRPGQSFSFQATNVKGQKVIPASDSDIQGARPLGESYRKY